MDRWPLGVLWISNLIFAAYVYRLLFMAVFLGNPTPELFRFCIARKRLAGAKIVAFTRTRASGNSDNEVPVEKLYSH